MASSLASAPDQVLTLVVSETLRGGWLRGVAVAAGPLLADGPIVVIAVTIMKELPPAFEPTMSLIGGVFLMYLAATALLNARRAVLSSGQPLAARGGLLTGLLARLLGPHPYLFWFLVGGPTLVQAQQLAGWPAVIAFLIGYYTTVVGSNVGLALALHRWIGLLSQRVYRGLLLVASLILAVYGVVLLGRAADYRVGEPAQ